MAKKKGLDLSGLDPEAQVNALIKRLTKPKPGQAYGPPAPKSVTKKAGVPKRAPAPSRRAPKPAGPQPPNYGYGPVPVKLVPRKPALIDAVTGPLTKTMYVPTSRGPTAAQKAQQEKDLAKKVVSGELSPAQAHRNAVELGLDHTKFHPSSPVGSLLHHAHNLATGVAHAGETALNLPGTVTSVVQPHVNVGWQHGHPTVTLHAPTAVTTARAAAPVAAHVAEKVPAVVEKVVPAVQRAGASWALHLSPNPATSEGVQTGGLGSLQPSELAHKGGVVVRNIGAGVGGALYSFRHPGVGIKRTAGDIYTMLAGPTQLAGLAMSTEPVGVKGAQAKEIALGMVDSLAQQIGPNTSVTDAFQFGEQHPGFAVTNAFMVADPAVKAATLGYLMRFKGLSLADARVALHTPVEPRTFTYQTPGRELPLGGRGTPGAPLVVEVPHARSPITRTLIQRPGDAISSLAEAIPGLRRLPFAEGKRAARAAYRQMNANVRRLPATTQTNLKMVQQFLKDDGEHYRTALAVALQKPANLTLEEWNVAVLRDMEEMLAGRAVRKMGEPGLTPVMQKRLNQIRRYRQKYENQLVRRRARAGRKDHDRLTGALDEINAQHQQVSSEAQAVENDPSISPKDKTKLARQYDAQLKGLETQAKVAQEELNNLTADLPVSDHPNRAQFQNTLEQVPYFQKHPERIPDMVAIGDARARTEAAQTGGSVDDYWSRIETRYDPTGANIPELAYAQSRPSKLPSVGELRTAAYKGVDLSVFREHKIDDFLNNLPRYLQRGEAYRKWYEHSGKAILDFAGGDKELASRAAQLVAIYSAARAPVENINLAMGALREWQAGRKITAGTAVQANKAEAIMRGEPWEGRKTNRFYANMLKHIDEKKYYREFPGGEVTNDIWMARLFGLKSDQPTPREYDAMTKITQNIAAKLDWSPEEVQAALWVPAKADAGRTVRIKGGGKGRVPMSDAEAGVNFADALGQEGARIPIEAAPGRRVAPELHSRYQDLTDTEKLAYADAKTQAVLDYLRDSNLFGQLEAKGVGIYKNETNPAFTLTLPLQAVADRIPKGETMSASSRLVMNRAISDIGRALNQDAMAWFRPLCRKGIEKTVSHQNGVYVELSRPLTAEETLLVSQKLNERIGKVALPPAPGNDLYALNFGDAKNGRFHTELDNAIKEAVDESGGSDMESVKYHVFHHDGELRTRSQYGQGQIRNLGDRGAGPPGLQDRPIDSLRARSDAIDRQFLGERGGEPGVPAEVPRTERPSAVAGGAGGAVREQGAEAPLRLAPDEPLQGLPPRRPAGGGEIPTGPSPEVRGLAEEYSRQSGIPYDPVTTYKEVDVPRAERIAQAYEDMLDFNDPRATPEYRAEVAASYKAMADETLAQYATLEQAGYKFEFYPRDANGEFVDPYGGNPWGAMADLRENKHLYVFPTEAGFGAEGDFARVQAGQPNPLLADSGVSWGGQPVLVNDLFRGVHDVFGHFKEGVGFRAAGEENAWRSHSAMYSPEARKAMTSETRGQNSWVNFGPHAEANRVADQLATVYAEQKTGILPQWVIDDGATDAPTAMAQTRRQDLLGASQWLDTPEGQRVIYFTQHADPSTVVHELVGHATEDLRRFYPAQFADVEAYVGRPYADWTVADHEQFARSAERYFDSGYSPIPELTGVFDRMKTWMRAIYAGIKRTLGPQLPYETRILFDHYFGAYDDANVAKINEILTGEGWSPEDSFIQQTGGTVTNLENEAAQIRTRTETRAYNKSLDALVTKTGQRARRLTKLDEKGHANWTQAELDEYRHLTAQVLQGQSDIVVRADRREQNLRAKIDELKKSMDKGIDNRRFQGALDALASIAADRESILRQVFGDRFDEVFSNRVDLLADWLVSNKLLTPKFDRGTATYWPMTGDPGLIKQLAHHAAPLTGGSIGKARAHLLQLYKRNEMIRWQKGDWSADPVVLMRAYVNAQSFAWMHQVKDLLHEMGRPLHAQDLEPGQLRGMTIINKDATPLGPQVKADIQRAQVHPDDASSTYSAQSVISAIEGDDNNIKEGTLKNYFDSFAIDPAHIPDGFNPLEHDVRVIPTHILETILRPLKGGATLGGKVVDYGALAARFALIYANAPAYIMANLPANIGMLFMHQGPFAIPTAMRLAARIHHDPLLRAKIEAEIGTLPAQSYSNPGRGFNDRVQHAETTWLKGLNWVDRYPRMIAWMYEAKKAGYSTDDQLMSLLDGKTAKTARDRARVQHFAVNHMFDFDRLTPWEKQVLSRGLFIWPFVRAATAYPFWYAKNYPGRTALISNLGLSAEARRKRMLGIGQIPGQPATPPWYEDLYPMSVNAALGTAQVTRAGMLSPTQVASGELRLIEDTIASATGRTPGAQTAALVSQFNPFLADGISAITHKDSYGQDVSLEDTLKQAGFDIVPGLRIGRGLVNASSTPRVFRSTDAGPVDRTLRTIVRINPQTVSLPWLHEQAVLHGDETPAARIKRKVEQAKNDIRWATGVPEGVPGSWQFWIKFNVTSEDALKEYARSVENDPSFLPTKTSNGTWSTKYTPSTFEKAKVAYETLNQMSPHMVTHNGLVDPVAAAAKWGYKPGSVGADVVGQETLKDISLLESDMKKAHTKAASIRKKLKIEKAYEAEAAGKTHG